MRKLIFLLLFPIFAFAAEKPIIILDPGHGGKDEGAKIRTFMEKKATLRTCYLTKKELEALGYKVVFTRAKDIFISLQNRVKTANKRSPNALFVSVHYNSAKSPAAKGIEVYYYSQGKEAKVASSKKLASSILHTVIHETSASSRGIKKGNFQVIRETIIPGVLIEAGFMTNAEERALLQTQPYLEKLARGIAAGIDKFVKG